MVDFKDGYDTIVRLNGANLSAEHGASYVSNVNSAIDDLTKVLREPPRSIENIDINHLKGFAAEWWHKGTFNIDAVLKDSSARAEIPKGNDIVDILLPDGEKVQLKYYKTGADSARAQALSRGTDSAYYSGQVRLIPADQMKDAEEWLRRKIAEESVKRPELVQRYQETLDNLSNRLESNGVESIPLDEERAKELARAMREDGLDPADFGLKTEELIEFDFIAQQAFKAGLTAALISIALKLGPQICGMICKLIKDGEIDAEDFKNLGFAALSGGAEGFVRGSFAAAITVSCKAGLLGTALKSANPSMIGAVVAITMNCVQNSCMLAFGKISSHEYANRSAQDLVIASCSIGLGVAGGALGALASTILTPAAAVFGYMIGSFVGSVVGTFIYKGVYSCIVSFCVDNGCTFFGLVEQNYEIPPDVLKSMGLEAFEYDKFNVKQFFPDTTKVKRFESEKFEPIGIDITYLRRGVIGVGIVGYV